MRGAKKCVECKTVLVHLQNVHDGGTESVMQDLEDYGVKIKVQYHLTSINHAELELQPGVLEGASVFPDSLLDFK